MNSFAIWYDGKKNKKHSKSCEVELHFNLWKLRKLKKKSLLNFSIKNSIKENNNMFLDVGIKVKNIKKVNKIFIFIPFKVDSANIEDVGIKMKDNRRLINGIFNDDCEIKHSNSKNGITIVKGNDIIKIHTLDYEFQKNILVENTQKGSIVTIDTKNDIEGEGEQSYYRFRIKGESINNFGQLIKQKDNALKTYSEKDHIIDFRVNEKRALPENLNMLLQKNQQFKIKVIHFLLLMDTSYELACTGLNYTMRALENNLWEDYLDNKYETHSLVGYHWKEKSRSKESIDNFNSYIRIKENKSSKLTILVYILGVMLISILTNIISDISLKQDWKFETIIVLVILIVWIVTYIFSEKRKC